MAATPTLLKVDDRVIVYSDASIYALLKVFKDCRGGRFAIG
jgi:hypothetical protein